MVASSFTTVVGATLGVASLGLVAFTIQAAFRSGALKSLRIGPLGLELDERRELDELINAIIGKAELPPGEAMADDGGQGAIPSPTVAAGRAARQQQQADLAVGYKLLSQYHGLGLAQSRISFWFSLIFAGLGFALIAVAVLAEQRVGSLSSSGSTLTLIAGTIVDAVAGLFFVQSNRSRQLMAAFFDRLRTDRKLEEALWLAETVPDPQMQSRLKSMLALSLAGVESTDHQVAALIGQPVTANPASSLDGTQTTNQASR